MLLDFLASKPHGSVCFHLPGVGIINITPMLCFMWILGGWNSDLSVCIMSTLLESSPQNLNRNNSPQ